MTETQGQKIDTADHVRHLPSGETWVVAYVRGDRLAWCGWPEGEAQLADCVMTKKATRAERIKLLRDLAGGRGLTSGSSNDARVAYARARLGLTNNIE